MASVSPKRERASPPQSDNSAPASPSHTSGSEFWRMQQLQQQARKAQAMYTGQQVAQRTSMLRDEAQRGAQPGLEHNFANQSLAFGSPTPFHFQANGGGAVAGKRSPFQNHPFQAGNLPSHSLARATNGGSNGQQPGTRQLTIFYAGMVNVYEDVPFDKAQAIMLLAGSGNRWSSNYINPPASSSPAAAAAAAPFRNPFLKAPMAAVPRSTPGSPAPPSPSNNSATGTPGVAFSNVRQAPITNVELPQARKASLARFLEKRKDRVRKAPVNEEEGEAASASHNNNRLSPAPAPATRSPSPSPSPSGSTAPHRGEPSGSEPSSPPTRPPGTPPGQNGVGESKRSPPRKRRGNASQPLGQGSQLHSNKRARSATSPHSEDSAVQ